MIIIVGLVILVAALAGVAGHRGSVHAQRDTARACTASSLGSDTPAGSRHPRHPP